MVWQKAGLLARSSSGAFPEFLPVAECLKMNGTYSCGHSSGIAPDSLLIPRSETLGLETKIRTNDAQKGG